MRLLLVLRSARLCVAVLLQCSLADAQFPLFNFGDLMQDPKNAKKPITKGEKKKSNKVSPSLYQLMGMGGETKPRHYQDTNTTSDKDAPKKVHPGLLSLFRPSFTADSMGSPRKKSKQLKSHGGPPKADSGFSALLSMLNNTASGSSNKEKARKQNSSDRYKTSKSSKSKKRSKSKKSKKGGRRSFNTSMSVAPSQLAFDSPSDSMPLVPLIQGTRSPTTAPVALSPGSPVTQPTATQAPIAPVFVTPVDPPPAQVISQTQEPTVAPVVVVTPTVTTNNVPTRVPSIAPVLSSATRSCSPTIGPCVETVAGLEAAVADSKGGDTIAVCAGTDPIVTQAAVNIALSDMKICCLGESTTRTCIIRSEGSSNNINVLGTSVRLQDLTFEDGFSENSVGGNVAIVGDGDHVIDNCEFRNGEATDTGGNLFVRTNGTLTIMDSIFSGGRAGNSGGSLYVLNARELSIADSTFENSTVSVQDSSGGGLFSSLESPDVTYSQQIDIQRATFSENTADLGGGFFVTQLGSLASVRILQTTFTDNNARSAGASGAIADSLDALEFQMEFSISSGNIAPICNDILGFYDNSTAPECLDIGVNFP